MATHPHPAKQTDVHMETRHTHTIRHRTTLCNRLCGVCHHLSRCPHPHPNRSTYHTHCHTLLSVRLSSECICYSSTQQYFVYIKRFSGDKIVSEATIIIYIYTYIYTANSLSLNRWPTKQQLLNCIMSNMSNG